MSMSMSKNERRKAGSVVRDLVRVRAIRERILFVLYPNERHPRGVAIIEVGGTTFTLRSEEDRATLVLGYQALLKAIPPGHSLQILIRRQPHDLSAFIQRLDALANERGVPQIYRHLAAAHADHLERLGGDGAHPLYRSRCYLIITAEVDARQPLNPFRWNGKRRKDDQQRNSRLIERDLDIQCERALSAVNALGLSAHRLHDTELANLAAQCLVPARDERRGLPDVRKLAVNRPVQPMQPTRVGSEAGTLPLVRVLPPQMPQNFSFQSVQAGGRASAGMGGYPPMPITPVIPGDQVHERKGKQQKAKPLFDPEKDGLPPPGWTHVADLLAPAAVQERPDCVLVDGEYLRFFAIVGYPREVQMGFLAPLLTHDESVDVSIHVHMQEPTAMLRRYRRRKAELHASKRLAIKQGRVDNPDEQVASDDVERLLLQVAKREEMLCEVGLYVQIRSKKIDDLQMRTDRLLALCKHLQVVAHPTTFEHVTAYQAMQPWGDDRLKRTTLLDTLSVAYGFPFLSTALVMAGGVLEGVTAAGEPVIIDDWADDLDNPHRFLGAVTGAGKSYMCKLKIMRELLMRYYEGMRHEGVQIAVIDPEREYERLCTELHGTLVRLAPGSTQHLNPFDLLPPGGAIASYLAYSRGDRLAEKVQSLHALYDLMLSDRGPTTVTPLSVREKGLLDRATYEAYRRKGITADPATHGFASPVLRDLYEVLSDGAAGKDEYGLCDRLYRYVEGSLSSTFSAPTDVRLDARLVVFDIRDMSGELRPIGILLIAECLWTHVLTYPRPRVLYIDEAWSLLEHPEGGRFLADLARRARKRYLRLVTITQSPEVFVNDKHGAVIAGNASTKVLKRQDRTSAQAVATRFGLTRTEQHALTGLQKPEALLLAGGTRLIVTVEANSLEHQLATTDPRELMQVQQARMEKDEQPSFSITSVSAKERAIQ